MSLRTSWIESANATDAPFPLNNLPYGVFSVEGGAHRCGVALGDRIIDACGLEAAGILRPHPEVDVFDVARWNGFMELGPAIWQAYRAELTRIFSDSADGPTRQKLAAYLVSMRDATLHLPFRVAEFTDFYAGRHHATNVGTMFRGPDNALPPNWLHMPIGYNGRASSIVVSGTEVRRPWGQLRDPETGLRFAPSERFDFELELGAIVGVPSTRPLTIDQADAHIFGYVLLNDWSARDIQAWEYQPLGPFQAKATATSVSPWIVTKAALEPFRCAAPERMTPLLPHLADHGPMHYDIDLSVELVPRGRTSQVITQTNSSELYYSAAQMLVHHSSSGCPMSVGDLLGSGTISGPRRHNRGSMLELSWGGTEPLTLTQGGSRCFLEDGDEIGLLGCAKGADYQIGFGACRGTVLDADINIYDPWDSS